MNHQEQKAARICKLIAKASRLPEIDKRRVMEITEDLVAKNDSRNKTPSDEKGDGGDGRTKDEVGNRLRRQA